MKWAYGITTVDERLHTLTPRTMTSLAMGGFDRPRMFIDGMCGFQDYTCRWPHIRPYANWLLGMVELLARDPGADRYAMFQDDVLCHRNMRRYLETCKLPDDGYWNLYTVPENQELYTAGSKPGWFLSNQRGKGALGLVFSQKSLIDLLGFRPMYDRMRDPRRGWRSIDGAVIDAMSRLGYKEWCHSPTLLMHTGVETTIVSHDRPEMKLPTTWLGENHDAMEFLACS